MLRWWQELKELLFPVFCVSCSKEGDWWCRACRNKEPIILDHFCAHCGRAVNFLEFCTQCPSPRLGVTALFKYQDGAPAARLIQLFKYRHARDIQKLWSEVFNEVVLALPKDTVVMPVPLFAQRERERGYNQAEVLAKLIATRFGLALDAHSLRRTRKTTPQVGLSRAERLQNLQGAFAWAGGPSPKNVLLVDDVCTTGSTLSAGAALAYQAGAGAVWALVLARD